MKAVLDAGPIIHLSWIDSLDLLDELFEEVLLPPAVRDEVLAGAGTVLGEASIVAALSENRLQVRALNGSPASGGALEAGETEAIALAQEAGIGLFVTDDAAARRQAERLGLTVTGTLGVLSMARGQGLVPAVLPLLLELRRLGQWISEDLIARVQAEEAGARP